MEPLSKIDQFQILQILAAPFYHFCTDCAAGFGIKQQLGDFGFLQPAMVIGNRFMHVRRFAIDGNFTGPQWVFRTLAPPLVLAKLWKKVQIAQFFWNLLIRFAGTYIYREWQSFSIIGHREHRVFLFARQLYFKKVLLQRLFLHRTFRLFLWTLMTLMTLIRTDLVYDLFMIIIKGLNNFSIISPYSIGIYS